MPLNQSAIYTTLVWMAFYEARTGRLQRVGDLATYMITTQGFRTCA